MYSVIDMFAGAGGLSLGFQQTRKFDIKVAFEINPNAQKTYRKNHPGTEIFDDVCKADYASIIKKYGNIDVVIGGPPCQGFSNANRQKNHAISMNNMLVKQYIRAILELQPKAFVMENVSMLKSNVHRFYMNEEDKSVVEEYHIPTEQTELIMLDELYATNRMLEIVQDINLIENYLWNEAEYLLINNIYRHRNNMGKITASLEKYKKKLMNISNKFLLSCNEDDEIVMCNIKVAATLKNYYQNKIEFNDIVNAIEKPIMIQRMLSKAKEIFDNNIIVERYSADGNISAYIRSFAVYDYIKCILGSEDNGYIIDSDVLCAADFGAPQKRMRFIMLGIKKNISDKVDLPKGHVKEKNYTTVKEAIGDISNIKPIYNINEDKGIKLETPEDISKLGLRLRDSNVLHNHIITETGEVALMRFEKIGQGENFHSLDKSMKENTYTDVSRTQNTIYLRLKYDEPSGTVVNVRKSMWIHPEYNRAVSIREAARLQTFPDSFIFEGSKDSQYQQVGNAVPPILAKSIARKLYKLLNKGLKDNN